MHFVKALLTGWLTEKYGARILVVLGGIQAAVGFVICGYSPDLLGVIMGFGIIGKNYTITTVMVEKKR